MADYRTDLRKMLRNIRMAFGFTQCQVAEFLQMNRSTYTYYERGTTTPDVPTLRLLADFYQIPIEAFIFPEEYQGEDLKKKRVRGTNNSFPNPQRIGELTPEEKELVMAYRAGKSRGHTEKGLGKSDGKNPAVGL